MFAGRRTMAGANATHEQHARAVIGFQIVDVGLKTCGISDANASTCTRLGGYDDTYCIAVGVERGRLSPSTRDRLFNFRRGVAGARCRHSCAERRAVAIVVAGGHRHAVLKMTLPSIYRRYRDEDAESGEYGNFHAHLLE